MKNERLSFFHFLVFRAGMSWSQATTGNWKSKNSSRCNGEQAAMTLSETAQLSNNSNIHFRSFFNILGMKRAMKNRKGGNQHIRPPSPTPNLPIREHIERARLCKIRPDSSIFPIYFLIIMDNNYYYGYNLCIIY